MSNYNNDLLREQEREISMLRQQLAELKADAERYRWLMKDDGHNALMATLAGLCATDDPIKPQMDAAIDVAMKGEWRFGVEIKAYVSSTEPKP